MKLGKQSLFEVLNVQREVKHPMQDKLDKIEQKIADLIEAHSNDVDFLDALSDIYKRAADAIDRGEF